MRHLAALGFVAMLSACKPAMAQPAAPPPPPAPPPPITLTLPELDWLIQQAAETPARWSFGTLQMLLGKRQQATAPAEKAP